MKSYIDDIVVTDPNGEEAVLYPRTKQEAVEGLQERLSNIELPDITTTDQTTLPNSHAGRLKFNEIVGDIEQDSTEGNQLFDSSVLLGRENNGVTFTNNGDGSFSVIGTTSDEVMARTAMVELELTSGTYTISGNKDNATVIIQVIDSEGNVSYYHESSSIGGTFTLDGAEQTVNFYIQVQVGLTVNTTVYPMLNAGTTALPWEPFTNGASPNPDYPQDINGSVIGKIRTHKKNFLEITNLAPSNSRGLSVEHLADGGIRIYGTHDGIDTFSYVLNSDFVLDKGTYILNGAPSSGSATTHSIRTNGTTGYYDNGKGVTFTLTEKTKLKPTIILAKSGYGGKTVDLTFYPMIREASIEDATYEPYQGKEITLSNPITLYGDVLSPQNVDRKYAVEVFDGSDDEIWRLSSTNATPMLVIDIYHNKVAGLCSHYSHAYITSSNTELGFNLTASETSIRFRPEDYATITVDEWKTRLASNPITVIYELAEEEVIPLPTADQIALNSLPTYDGITYVEFIDVGVMPSVSLDYGTSKIGGMTLEGLLAGINGELQSQLNNDRITALESAVVNNV